VAVEGPTDKGDQAIAPYVAVSRFARPGKCNAKIAGRAGPKREFISARTKSANHKFHSKMLTEEQSRLLANPQQMRRPGCGNAVAAGQIPMAAQP
jgi:hypothetical protein